MTDSILEPGPHLNFLTGSNGQGKTSFLEALGFIATLRSFKGSKSHEIIQYGKTNAETSCLLSAGDPATSREHWATKLKIDFQLIDPEIPKATKTAFINDKTFKSSLVYLSQRFGSFKLGFHAVVFNPSDHDLVRGEPAIRRAYLDRVISANDVEYLNVLQKYLRVLNQRNAVLKNTEHKASDLLYGFTGQLGKYAAILVYKRLKWLKQIQKQLNNTAQKITPGGQAAHLFYCSNWVEKTPGLSICYDGFQPPDFTGQSDLPLLELLEQTFWEKASSLEALEWRVGHTMVGPHRDDWTFLLGDQTLRGHGSQGEVRSALLALKISEIEVFRSTTGHRPLFLLDDFSSELDQDRRRFLLKFLSETDLQVFITTTEDQSFEGKRFRILNGQVSEV